MKKLLLALALISATATANAFYTGNDLLALTKGDQFATRLSQGIVAGAFSAIEVYEVDKGYICTPEGLTLGQVRAMTMQQLEARPDLLHLAAGYHVWAALFKAYPCTKKGTK